MHCNLKKIQFPDFVLRFKHYHIIFGTPKEMVAYRKMNVFDLNKLHSAVFDDADLVASSNAVKLNIINPTQKKQLV